MTYTHSTALVAEVERRDHQRDAMLADLRKRHTDAVWDAQQRGETTPVAAACALDVALGDLLDMALAQPDFAATLVHFHAQLRADLDGTGAGDRS